MTFLGFSSVSVIMIAFLIIQIVQSNLVVDSTYKRPSHITKALESNTNVYYLGVGSNLLKEKVINRGLNGSIISVNSFEAARVENHRLAFNMRGFLPTEPAMGGIEECKGSSCHGALMEMKASEYQKLWLSEGGGQAKPGYEEVIVDAFPYGSNVPVKAIALRASNAVRLSRDAPPSARYMDLIIRGAEELKLDDFYIQNLKAIPISKVSGLLNFLAKKHIYFVGFLFRQKLRFAVVGLNKMCWFFYYPTSGYSPIPVSAYFDKAAGEGLNGIKCVSSVGRIAECVRALRAAISTLCVGLVILPGALIGILIEFAYKFIYKKSPPGLFGRPAPVTPKPALDSAPVQQSVVVKQ